MTTLYTADQINAMTAPALRKLVKDNGADPKTMKGPDEMKAWAIDKLVPKAAVAKPAKNGKPATTPPTTPKPPVNTDKPPAAPATKPEVKTDTKAPTATFLGSLPGLTPEMKSYLEVLELRLATAEDMLGISAGRVTPPAAAVDKYAIIRPFLKEVGEDTELAMTQEQVQAATKPQLLLVLECMKLAPKSDDVRELRAQVAAQFAAAPPASKATPPKSTSAPATKTTSAAATSDAVYVAGDVVKATYDGTVFDPCQIMKATLKRGKTLYTVFFDEDGTWIENVSGTDIGGKSSNAMTKDPAEYGYEE